MSVALGALLAHKIGPLPAGVWVVAGGAGLFTLYRKRMSSAGATAAAPAAPPTDGQGGQVTTDPGTFTLSPIIDMSGLLGNGGPADPSSSDSGSSSTTTPPPYVSPIGPVIAPPVPRPAPTPAPTAPRPTTTGTKPGSTRPATRTYTIVSGDTLSGIAARFRVVGGWPRLYAVNRAAIEAAAHAHGRSSSGGGHWIYPGTRLVIP